jgi:uncharacterized protein (TIGR00297 family)
MDSEVMIFVVVLIVTVLFIIKTKKLTITAAVVAGIMASFIYVGVDFGGIILLGSFFIIGVFVTSWKSNFKKPISTPGENDSTRNTAQVLANGGVALILAIVALIFPDLQELMLLLIACSFSSATADTVSSELGMVYGKRFYNISTFKADVIGENGVISTEGTLLGILGSMIIAIIYCLCVGWSINSVLIIVVAGTIGNIADSFLGATAERNHLLGNNAVNFLNTLMAAIVGGLLSL